MKFQAHLSVENHHGRGPLLSVLFLLAAINPMQTVFAGDDFVPFGPIPVWERNPIYGFFYTSRAEPVSRFSDVAWSIETGLAFSNLFEVQRSASYDQDFDFELTSLDLDIRRRFGKRWVLGGLVELRALSGGFLDNFISDFHGALGLPNDNRDDFPDNRFSFRFGPVGETPLFDLSSQSATLADPVLFGKLLLGKGDAAIQLVVKPPWGDAALSAGGVDIALEHLYQRRGPRHAIHTKAGWVHLDVPTAFSRFTEDQAVYGTFSWEWYWQPRLVPILQLDGGSAYFRDTGLSTLDEIPLNLTLGLAGKIGGTRWRIGFSEDILSSGPSVDFTLSLFFDRQF